MNPLRTPVVLGVGPRTGASTIAAALHAHDGGVRDVGADVVVCSGAEESLRRAEMLGVVGARPHLAVVLLDGGPAPAASRLRLAGRRYAGVTVLPHVGEWSGPGRTAGDVGTLLAQHPDRLPRAHRAYADALRAVAAALLDTGLLARPRPPLAAIPRPGHAPPVAVPVPMAQPAPPPVRRHPVRLSVVHTADVTGAGRIDRPCGLPPAPPPARRGDHDRLSPVAATPLSANADLDDLDDEALEHAVALLGTR